MYQREIMSKESGQRLDRYLCKLLPEAGNGFLHKMLRKKNITLNGKKALGSEILTEGDKLAVFFAEETLRKFMGQKSAAAFPEEAACREAYAAYQAIPVLYEDEHILLADKPAGLLTQKAKATDVSLNEWLIGYLLSRGEATPESLLVHRPAACNRLDRNPGGIVLCAKSLRGARLLSDLLRERGLRKYYRLYVKGAVRGEQTVEGYLVKDERQNKVTITPVKEWKGTGADSGLFVSGRQPTVSADTVSRKMQTEQEGAYIKTAYRPLCAEGDKTLLEVELITGKPHQIRAHLAGIGHPLLGDYKYGDRAWNDYYKKTCRVESQLLHACRVEFPALEEPFAALGGRVFVSKLPPIFSRVAAQRLP